MALQMSVLDTVRARSRSSNLHAIRGCCEPFQHLEHTAGSAQAEIYFYQQGCQAVQTMTSGCLPDKAGRSNELAAIMMRCHACRPLGRPLIQLDASP